MIDYEFKDLFLKQDIDKQILIEYDTGSLTNNEVHQEKFSLEESLCSEDNLVFGTCEASVLKFTASNVFESLKNKWLEVSTTLSGNDSNPFKFGRYKVYSDVPTADRKKRDVVAYDALYDVLKSDVAEWYNDLLPNDSSEVSLKAFRDAFFSHFGIAQEEIELPNDDMVVAKTIGPTELSGKTVINAICEINGCFGHIGRNGKFKYIFLEPITEGIYPSENLYPSETLFPADPGGATINTGTYIPPLTYENFIVEAITGVQIRQEENDIGAAAGSTRNTYVIQDNFLVYGKGTDELLEIAEKILEVIKGIVYCPFNTKAKGNPCLEVGDAVRLNTKTQIIQSYVLQRTLKGIQTLRDTYVAEGAERQETKVNSVKDQIIQLKGKANILTRTVEETRSELSDLKEQTSTSFTQTAEKIESVATDVDKIDGVVTKQESRITENANSISAEVTRATEEEERLSGRIALSAQSIELKLTDGETSAGIEIILKNEAGEKIDAKSGNINITGMVTFRELDEVLEGTGTTRINGANIITGTITADQINSEEIFSFFEISTKYVNATSALGSGAVDTNNLTVTVQSSLGELATADKLEVTGSISCSSLWVNGYGPADWQTVTVMDSNGNPLQINFLGTLDVG